MEETKVPLYPVSSVIIRVSAEQGLVMINLPYFTGFNTDKQQLHHDHAYALLEEHAKHMRDLLDDALQRIANAK
jgi:hypothetical protein